MNDLVGIVLDSHSPSPNRREGLLWSVLHFIRRLDIELTKWQNVILWVMLRDLQQGVSALDGLAVKEGVSSFPKLKKFVSQ